MEKRHSWQLSVNSFSIQTTFIHTSRVTVIIVLIVSVSAERRSSFEILPAAVFSLDDRFQSTTYSG
jgi:hypothetical protein